MQSTFKNLNVGFKGKYGVAGFPALVENGGIRTVGGFISKDNTPGTDEITYIDGVDYKENTPLFGVPLFALPAKPYEFFVGNGGVDTNIIGGNSANMVFRGFLLNRAMINEQYAAMSAEVLPEQPCDAVYQGAVWLQVEEGNTGDSVEIGKDIFVDANGQIFCDSANASGATQVAIANSKIVEKHSEVDGLYLVMLS